MTLDSEHLSQSRNSLLTIASTGSVLVGVILLLGAYGHLSAVLPNVRLQQGSAFILLLPGVLLAIGGVLNIAICKALWDAARWSLDVGLAANGLAATYVMYLMTRELPDHPIGLFLAMLSSQLLVLIVIRAGLVWPAPQTPSDGSP